MPLRNPFQFAPPPPQQQATQPGGDLEQLVRQALSGLSSQAPTHQLEDLKPAELPPMPVEPTPGVAVIGHAPLKPMPANYRISPMTGMAPGVADIVNSGNNMRWDALQRAQDDASGDQLMKADADRLAFERKNYQDALAARTKLASDQQGAKFGQQLKDAAEMDTFTGPIGGYNRLNNFLGMENKLDEQKLKNEGLANVETIKGKNARELEQSNFENLQKLFGSGGLSSNTTPAPVPSHTPAAAPPPGQTSQPQSQSWWDFLTGKGPNSASAALGAMNERAKYATMATPTSKLNQDISFANLQQLSGQFPGVRGFSYLLPLMAQHQANYGKGETPEATYHRLQNMSDIMQQTMGELDNPALRVTVGPDMRPRINMPPQTIARGKMAIQDALMRTRDAIQEMESLYPELRGTAPATAGGGNRFERIQ